VSVKGLLFIDANQYLDLYRTVSGKKVLPAVLEQRNFIFVTEQIVDEVNRQKVKVTADFLADWLKKLELNSIPVPDHLLSTVGDGVVRMREQLQKTHEKVKETKEEFKKLTHDVLEQVSQSKDDVSNALAGIFSQAIKFTDAELESARARKERGNPPGKKSDSLGDQLTWEQLLSRCKDKPKLWIITRDSDYGTVYAGKMFLNAALYQELARLYKSEPEVFCFDNIAEGLTHFTETTGAKAEKLPTPEETEQIKKEQESLPPLGWLTSYDDSYPLAMRLQDASRMSDSLATRLSQVVSSDEAIPPPATKEADRDGA
jgi:PIN domain